MLTRLSWSALATALGLVSLAGCGGGGSSSEPVPNLSGTISIESRTRVDTDTANDSSLGMARSNNDASNAQHLPETGIAGGYLSASAGVYPGSNSETEFSFNIDRHDVFEINLLPGDRVALQVFPSSVELPTVGMTIARPGGADVCGGNCSGNPPFTHIIQLAGDDPVAHVIDIEAIAGGPFRYVLTVSSARSQSASQVRFDQPDLVPDEAIILTGDDAGAAMIPSAAEVRGLSNSLATANLRDLGRGYWRVSRSSPGIVRRYAVAETDEARQQTLEWIRELRQSPGVVLAEPNYLYRTQAVAPDDDPLYARQWHYPQISLPVAWQAAPQGGAGVGVAVLDTGLFSSVPGTYGNWHPDLGANVVGVTGEILDYVTGELDIDGEDDGLRDTNPADPGDGTSLSSNFHGTHVAGIIAGVDNQQGIVGVAPSATLFPVRVLGRGGEGNTADLIAAINWAASHSDIDVINLSLGGVADSQALQSAIDQAYANGKLIVAAAGNENTDALTFPAAYERVVGVGAVDGGRVRASYSNIGGSVDLVAPGGDASRDANLDGDADLVVSAWGDDSSGSFVAMYAGLQGTSMAAPHVSGVYALMKGAAEAAGGDLAPGDFFALMLAGDITDNVGNATEYGAGLINAVKAINALASPIPTVVAASPSTLEFSDAATQQTLNLVVYPDSESVLLDSVGTLPDWLSLVPALVTGSALPTEVDVVVDTSRLSLDASYSTEVQFGYTVGGQSRELTVPVSVQRADAVDQRDAGRHYVQLRDPNDPFGRPLHQVTVELRDGRYPFAFTGVEPGEYLLVAGSDIDNDGRLCQNGEACAEYPVTGRPQPITLGDEPVTGVSIVTGYRRPTLRTLGLPRYGFDGYPVHSIHEPADDAIRSYTPAAQ